MSLTVNRIDDFIKAVHTTFQASVHMEAFGYIKESQRCLAENQRTRYRECIDKAKHLWEKHYQAHPEDYVCTHHLAVLYHSQAWEKEQQEESRQALEDWRQALIFWLKVWQEDAFWQESVKKMIRVATDQKGFAFFQRKFTSNRDRLPIDWQDFAVAAEKWDEALDYWFKHHEVPEWWKPFEKIGIPLGGVNLQQFLEQRKKLPQDLLKIHYTLILHYQAIARKEGKKPEMAYEHWKLISTSGFETRYTTPFRDQLAKDLLPDRVSIEQGRQFQEGVKRAEWLLQIDPENIWGLEFIMFCYNQWNLSCIPQSDLNSIENNLQKINNSNFVDRIKRGVQQSDCPRVLAFSLESLLKDLYLPLVIVSKDKANDLIGKYNRYQTLSLDEQREVFRCLENVKQYADEADNRNWAGTNLATLRTILR